MEKPAWKPAVSLCPEWADFTLEFSGFLLLPVLMQCRPMFPKFSFSPWWQSVIIFFFTEFQWNNSTSKNMAHILQTKHVQCKGWSFIQTLYFFKCLLVYAKVFVVDSGHIFLFNGFFFFKKRVVLPCDGIHLSSLWWICSWKQLSEVLGWWVYVFFKGKQMWWQSEFP